MNSDRSYTRYTWFVLIMVFLVILAGGVVRMTQSGMGCPDWPKCFGMWIPPTDESQLPPDFEKYLDAQDIDHSFNVYHTWIEYINRLLGALLGVFILVHFIRSFSRYRKKDRAIVYLSLLLLLGVAFQGWLGKKVVDHNLAVVKVTTHMLMALVLAAIPLLIIYRLQPKEKTGNAFLKRFSVFLLLLLLVQVVLGTQVREQVDEISKSLSYGQREQWIGRLDNIFLLHRSFSWLLLAACLFLYWKARVFVPLRRMTAFMLLIVVCTIALGIVMNFAGMPAVAQPLHLLLASILVLTVFAFRLRIQ